MVLLLQGGVCIGGWWGGVWDMFYRVAQLSIVVGGLARPLLCAHVYWFVICFYLVWSMVLFFVLVFVLLCFSLGFVYSGPCKLASKQLYKKTSEPQNEQLNRQTSSKCAVPV